MKLIDDIIASSSVFPGGFFVYKADEKEEIVHVNDEVLYIYGCSTLDEFKRLTGNSFRGMVYKDDLDKIENSICKQICSNLKNLDYVEYRIQRLDGEIRYVEDFGRLVNTDDGDYFFVFITDVTEKYNKNLKYKEVVMTELRNRIQYDSLTGLLNKEEFIRRVSAFLTSLDVGYIIYFDIDKFSLYTNLFGINAGDRLLLYVANILNNLGNKQDMIHARLYNDIFVIFTKSDLSKVDTLINSIKVLTKQYTDNYDINISFGVYKITDKSISVGNMIDYAQMALETIKEKYEKKYAIYDESLSDIRLKEQVIINNMESALANKEFCIYLQPKYDIRTNEIIGAESLVRWIHEGKIISPGEFIPIFEQNGFITKLDLYIWEETCRYIRYRIDNNLKSIPISVNVSRLFLALNSFIPDVKGIIEKYNIPTNLLEFEITESLFSNSSLIRDKVNELRGLGFKVHMDDFGSGYSGLSVLKDVDFDIMKLDLRFFESSDEKSKIIIETVIQMAKKLHIPVIAEGVETLEHVNILKQFGCNYAQGFYYSRPIPVNEFNKLMD